MSANSRHGMTSGWLKATLETTATLLVIVTAVALLYQMIANAQPAGSRGTAHSAPVAIARPSASLPDEPLSLDGAATRGSNTARVAIIEYSDFQCPYCGVFARSTWPAIEEKYIRSGQVLMVFRHFPLRTIHAFAGKAAEAAACAGAAGKFWEMHDALFAGQSALDESTIRAHALRLGIDTPEFSSCLAGQMAPKVGLDEESGRSLGVSGTPTFFVGLIQVDGRVKVTQRLQGAGSLPEFSEVIDRLLKQEVSLHPR